MARPGKNPSELTLWRLNQSIRTGDIMRKTGMTQASIYRLEKGGAISRPLANQYLSYWGVDINNLNMLPDGLHIVDEGWSVRVKFTSSTTE